MIALKGFVLEKAKQLFLDSGFRFEECDQSWGGRVSYVYPPSEHSKEGTMAVCGFKTESQALNNYYNDGENKNDAILKELIRLWKLEEKLIKAKKGATVTKASKANANYIKNGPT